ncbi:UbiD family decarboxylase [Aspergillus fijiensis CBS 313.89]|uniref:Ferulic acid decarboxylase 1 n=1 Tax=Aspergillus fijiensis CBS 313.89 TaxID=1448319 RepID=A0A8G1RDV3_9EURO|nr:putative 3-octaprenyl-4-hydroxybenzoate carboxy-lyase [Aspergillus fijiensis CBS 313.89]RAK71450.1 putative 3-octaprenyl-4-hydroxybenzoate carboxy-lyase [Aspergillus fijiensis CBS 313.89]
MFRISATHGRWTSAHGSQRHYVHQATPQGTAPDFRSFLNTLRADGDLVDIYQEVDPHLEVGAIARRVSERNAQVPLFHQVKGARDGLWRMTSNLQSLCQSPTERLGRIARGIGLPPSASWREINTKLLQAKRSCPSVASSPVLSTGPCKENKIFGDQINMMQLPAPLLHQGDGGRYVQTYGMHILQSPDGSWINWSIARAMINDRNKLVGLCIPPQHNWQIKEMWRKQGHAEVPWALALGVPPAAIIAAGLPIPDGVSELDYVNAITGSPMGLVRCETNDLLVPASCEIVFEGTLSNTETALEGPFGEYFGHGFEGESRQMPIYHVNAITHRGNAILPISVPGVITDESHTLAALMVPEILDICLEHGLPISDAFAPLETNATWVFLQVNSERLRSMGTNAQQLCRSIGQTVFQDKRAWLASRLFLVGDDIDIYDFQQTMWAVACRSRPGQDDYGFDDVPGLPLVPSMRGSPRPCRGGKTVTNCLLESEFTAGGRDWHKVDFQHAYPKDVQERVLSRWGAMGLK